MARRGFVGDLRKIDWKSLEKVIPVAKALDGVVAKHSDRPNYNIYPNRASAEKHGAAIVWPKGETVH